MSGWMHEEAVRADKIRKKERLTTSCCSSAKTCTTFHFTPYLIDESKKLAGEAENMCPGQEAQGLVVAQLHVMGHHGDKAMHIGDDVSADRRHDTQKRETEAHCESPQNKA